MTLSTFPHQREPATLDSGNLVKTAHCDNSSPESPEYAPNKFVAEVHDRMPVIEPPRARTTDLVGTKR
jgi:hypothetical protein